MFYDFPMANCNLKGDNLKKWGQKKNWDQQKNHWEIKCEICNEGCFTSMKIWNCWGNKVDLNTILTEDEFEVYLTKFPSPNLPLTFDRKQLWIFRRNKVLFKVNDLDFPHFLVVSLNS